MTCKDCLHYQACKSLLESMGYTVDGPGEDADKRCEEFERKEQRSIKVLLDEGAFMPEYAHKKDAGADLRSPVDEIIWSEGAIVIDTGVHVEIPSGCVGFLKSKSGLNVNHGLVSEGVIDEGYTGSIRVKLYNHGDDMHHIKRGDKITQLVILPVVHAEFEQVEKLEETERGSKGFGSSGR